MSLLVQLLKFCFIIFCVLWWCKSVCVCLCVWEGMDSSYVNLLFVISMPWSFWHVPNAGTRYHQHKLTTGTQTITPYFPLFHQHNRHMAGWDVARQLDSGDTGWKTLGSVWTHPACDGHRVWGAHPTPGQQRTATLHGLQLIVSSPPLSLPLICWLIVRSYVHENWWDWLFVLTYMKAGALQFFIILTLEVTTNESRETHELYFYCVGLQPVVLVFNMLEPLFLRPP